MGQDCFPTLLRCPVFGVHYTSEKAREERIREGSPGSPCRKGYLRSNTEITDKPICRASKSYHKRLQELLENGALSEVAHRKKKSAALVKSCLCQDLSGGALLKYGIDPQAATAICPGPNIVNFCRIASLSDLIDHIYGRTSLINNPRRPHMFVRELKLYLDYYRAEVEKLSNGTSEHPVSYLKEFGSNLLQGIAYYLGISEQIEEE